jgi:hypothetical protein
MTAFAHRAEMTVRYTIWEHITRAVDQTTTA